MSTDVTDVEPLTPGHLLCGRRITFLPHEYEENLDDPDYMDAPAMRQQDDRHYKILNHFQSRWKREYLTSLREFHKTSGHNKQSIKKGDVVSMHEDKPRLNCRLAVIEELLIGNDGLVGVANIRTAYHVTSRPISKLYPLELSTTQNVQDEIVTEENNDISTAVEERSKQRAADKARSRISQWTGDLSCPPEDVEN